MENSTKEDIKAALRAEIESAKEEVARLRGLLGLEDEVLPAGWKKYIDKTSGRPYYVNKWVMRCVHNSYNDLIWFDRDTKEKSWKKPAIVKVAVIEDQSTSSTEEKSNNTVKSINRYSRRLSREQSKRLTAQMIELAKQSEDEVLVRALDEIVAPSAKEQKIANLRILNEELKNQPAYNGCTTVSQLEILGNLRKTGYLSKQSKLIGRWVGFYEIVYEIYHNNVYI